MRFLLLLIILLLFFSCKRREETTWDINVHSPLIKTSLSINNLLHDSILNENPDSSLMIDYSYSLNAFNTDSAFKIPDTIINAFYNIPFGSPTSLNPGFQFANDPASNQFNYGDARITEMKLTSGKIKFKIISQINEKTIYTYEVLKSDDGNGNLFTKKITVPAGTVSSPGIAQGEFDLDGYTFDMTGTNSNSYNTLETRLKVLIDPDGNSVLVSGADSVLVENGLINLKPAYIKGFIGTSTFDEPNSELEAGLFDNIISGGLDIDQLDVTLSFTNYIGAELRFKLNHLRSLNSRTSNTISLSHNIIGNDNNINRATLSGSTITPYVVNYQMNTSNSNIDLFLENLPTAMEFGFEAEINPLGNISSGNDFLFINKTIDINFDVMMPLSLIANNLTLLDTIELSIDSANNRLKKGDFTLIAENGFPFDAELQLYLLDIDNNVIDSLFNGQIITSGTLNGANRVINSTTTTIMANLNEDKIKLLEQNNRVILTSRYHTLASSHTTIYSNYKLDLKLIGDITYEASIK